jgi:hypothetical protein
LARPELRPGSSCTASTCPGNCERRLLQGGCLGLQAKDEATVTPSCREGVTISPIKTTEKWKEEEEEDAGLRFFSLTL